MRKNLSVVAVALAVVVSLGLSVATVGKAIADSCSGCGCCNYINWNSSPTSTNADSDGDFSFNQVVNWASDNDAGLIAGTITFDSANSFYIGSVAYTPNFFSPYGSCCAGTLTVQTSGTLSPIDQNGTLRTKAAISVTSPQRQSSKTVTIYHS